MKKAAILCITAFYLLLTTGSYVCILHCGAAYFFQPVSAMQPMNAHHEMHSGKEHKPCSGSAGCDCCKKHGSYVIKENVKAGSDFQLAKIPFFTNNFSVLNITRPYSGLDKLIRPASKAPPGNTVRSIFIKLHSLQI